MQTHSLILRLSLADLERVDIIADHLGVGRTEAIRRAIREVDLQLECPLIGEPITPAQVGRGVKKTRKQRTKGGVS